jgi:hypothetical protein
MRITIYASKTVHKLSVDPRLISIGRAPCTPREWHDCADLARDWARIPKRRLGAW